MVGLYELVYDRYGSVVLNSCALLCSLLIDIPDVTAARISEQ